MFRVSFCWLFVGLFLASCASGPEISMQQRRAMQMRSFESSYDNIFKSFKSVLQDEGYIIKNQDYPGGMLLAQKETESGGGWAGVLSSMGGNNNTVTGKGYEVSVNFDKISKNNIETRLTLQGITSTSMGGKQGREIVEPKLYKSIYDRVIVEIERRKAKGL